MTQSNAEVWIRLESAFPNLSEEQWKQLRAWSVLLRDWNEKINLVSRKDIEHLESRHLAHSLFFSKHCNLKPGLRVLDVGTGGGLPGIPLAVLYPETDFLLVDSIGKKVTVVNELARELDLPNVKGRQARAEEMKEKFDCILGRAVASLDRFLPWVWPRLKTGKQSTPHGGVYYWKGGDWQQEWQDSGFPKPEFYPMTGLLGDDWFVERGLLWFKAQPLSSR